MGKGCFKLFSPSAGKLPVMERLWPYFVLKRIKNIIFIKAELMVYGKLSCIKHTLDNEYKKPLAGTIE
jgi:hypothetical protein